MSKIYYGNSGSGDSLKHYRTKGSKNGYSKNPNYKVVGQRAKGKWVNGRYVYDNPAAQQGSKNDWQQRGNLHRTVRDISTGYEQTRIGGFTGAGAANAAKVKGDTDSYTRGTDQWRYDPSYANASARVAAGKRVSTPQRTQVASAKSKRDKAIAKGAANNWQKQAAAAQNQANMVSRIKEGKSKSANMNSMGFEFNVSKTADGKKQIIDYSTARAHQNAVNQANAEARARNAIANRGSSGKKMTKQLTNFGSGQKSKEYEEELAYNSKKNVYPSSSRPVNEASRIDTPSPDPSSWRYTTVDKTAMGRRIDTNRVEDSPNGGTRYATEIVDPRYNIQGTQKIEKAKQEAARKAKEKETNGQYFTFDKKTGRTIKTSPGIEAEKKRIEAGKKAREKRNAKKQSLISKIKSLFSKKK